MQSVTLIVCIALSLGASVFTLSPPVQKAINAKVWVHLMPWHETRDTNTDGQWGIHWTMANRNPDNMDGSGRRDIATYYYPEIGPYGSGDGGVIEYQLLLMKYAGVDGILLDWPGTVNAWDYPKNLQNSNNIINRLDSLGLEFAIVYEDHNIGMAADAGFISDKHAAGRQDMQYIQNNYFNRGNYIRVNGAPLLLDFGPQTFTNPGDWANIFSVLNQRPTFLTLWYQSHQAEGNVHGEYCWIYSDFIDGLNNFYFNRPLGVKMGVAYPGFNTFYAAGGWPGPDFSIPVGQGTFSQTLDLAINGGVSSIQLATWNDYGEGTMIEPTREFGQSFLNILQQKLRVPYSSKELDLVTALYHKRKQHAGEKAVQTQLDEVFDALAALEPEHAAELLAKIP